MKSNRYYYNEDVTWVPYTKEQLDKMDQKVFENFESNFVQKTNWYHAKRDGIEVELNQYSKELHCYAELRFPTLVSSFAKWEKRVKEGPGLDQWDYEVAKFLVDMGLEKLLWSHKDDLMKKLPTLKYITGLTFEEYNK